jgi:hypothetical protein
LALRALCGRSTASAGDHCLLFVGYVHVSDYEFREGDDRLPVGFGFSDGLRRQFHLVCGSSDSNRASEARTKMA